MESFELLQIQYSTVLEWNLQESHASSPPRPATQAGPAPHDYNADVFRTFVSAIDVDGVIGVLGVGSDAGSGAVGGAVGGVAHGVAGGVAGGVGGAVHDVVSTEGITMALPERST